MNRAIRRVGIAVTALILILVAQLTYFQVIDANSLKNDPRNVRTTLDQYNRARGDILTAEGDVVARSVPTGTNSEFDYQREYPLGGLFAQIAGYQSFVVGNAGVEKSYDGVLTGREKKLDLGNLAGVLQGKQDTQNVVLSVRHDLQQLAADQLQGRKGSVVVLDTHTGAVLAMYSNPTFDPSPLASHDTQVVNFAYQGYTADPANPMLPRSYRETFAPGSTFKTVTSISGLDAQLVTPDTFFPARDHLDLPQTNTPIGNFGGETCGGTLTEAFAESCNVVFAEIGLELGNDFVPRMANCGVAANDAPPLDLDPSAVASAGPPAGSFDNDKPSFARSGIGQDPVRVTPLEMAMVAAGIANGGVMMTPYVGQQITDSTGSVLKTATPKPWKTCTSPATAAQVTSMMESVVDSPNGTGGAARIPGVRVAGKSGTAQTEPGKPPHAWFVAFAPAEAPRYAVSVMIESAEGVDTEQTGGAVAAPIAGAMLQAALAR